MRAIATCPDCEGTGWILKDRDSVPVVEACPSCRARLKTQRILEEAAIPPRYRDRGFEVYSIHHPLQEKALKRSVEFVEAFPSVERGILFVGPCGVGKTHLSVAILKTLIEERGVVGRFVDETVHTAVCGQAGRHVRSCHDAPPVVEADTGARSSQTKPTQGQE